eukprot:TRINITY_DN44514_c0_g1_i2.p1 TRINITY_DN44514_c0_g1~~TRINITY_DN44514_c0_g1_i2.p1  ORF type:complete len:169 (+),score=60.56 TRINITY_DN44514_c0_g1_i2:654-1160(+)
MILHPHVDAELDQLYSRISRTTEPRYVPPSCEEMHATHVAYSTQRADAKTLFEWNTDLSPHTAAAERAQAESASKLEAMEQQAQRLTEKIQSETQKQTQIGESLSKAKLRAENFPGLEENKRLRGQIAEASRSLEVVKEVAELPKAISTKMVSKLESDFEAMCSQYGM